MKKLFVFLFGLFVFTSCFNDGTKEVTENNGGIGGRIYGKKFMFEGHRYIEFKDNGLYGHGYVHDPKCPTCNPEENLVDSLSNNI